MSWGQIIAISLAFAGVAVGVLEIARTFVRAYRRARNPIPDLYSDFDGQLT